MKLYQVFDCQDMPQQVRANFYQWSEHVGNDCYIIVDLTDFKNMTAEIFKEECGYNDTDGGALFMQWLLDNGATDEAVLVNHWW